MTDTPTIDISVSERRALDGISWPTSPDAKSKYLAQIALDPDVSVKDASAAAGIDRDLPRKWRQRDESFAAAERMARSGGDPREPESEPGPTRDPYALINDPAGAWLSNQTDEQLVEQVVHAISTLEDRRRGAMNHRHGDSVESWNAGRSGMERSYHEARRRGLSVPALPEPLRSPRRRGNDAPGWTRHLWARPRQ